MKILVLGSDGYIGYPLTISLLKQGHEVLGLDDASRRKWVHDIGGASLTPIKSEYSRELYLKATYPNFHGIKYESLDHYSTIEQVLHNFKPDTIVHLAEQPSAPWSMRTPYHAAVTQTRNVIGNLNLLWAMKEECPEAHLVKLGSMGEYGTPECDIPEGKIPLECIGNYVEAISIDLEDEYIYKCPMSGLLFPRQANSFYHLSKVMDTLNIEFCCRNWGFRSTDIMQGVVFGLGEFTSEYELTRFDYDQYFGTVINRFCAQAIINHPLTIYGSGNQRRGFLPLQDSIQCLNIAINNPSNQGEYRTLNQFENIYSIIDLGSTIISAMQELGMDMIGMGWDELENPRNELDKHYYNPSHQTLFDLGYKPTTDIRSEIRILLSQLLHYKERVIPSVIMPTTTWK